MKPPSQICALFGEDHGTVNEFALALVGGPLSGVSPTACAVGAGGDGVLTRKGPAAVLNEDCVLAFDDGRRVIHAIADGHHGHEASHSSVELVATMVEQSGGVISPDEALAQLHPLWLETKAESDGSRCTLVVLSIDRGEGILEGFSLGDSGVFLGNMEDGVRRVVPPNTFYMAPWDPGSHGIPPSTHFRVPVRSGDWVLTCSDGIHECKYETPEESIGAKELESLMIRAGRRPEAFVESAVTLALAGVSGHPGGEDNLAVVASIA
ncbi:SpoIIE family protein phosphatase [Planctomycetota bacterium]|nr:SpoIIE family protein phosphatase [Planctomycetota bacterium]MDB4559277.1 SpoIIE family protein phosphatase [Planctomycetota bacterium]MDB4736188.1 SpoIIE family protein phosphatase [Planctomycetota bacterium]